MSHTGTCLLPLPWFRMTAQLSTLTSWPGDSSLKLGEAITIPLLQNRSRDGRTDLGTPAPAALVLLTEGCTEGRVRHTGVGCPQVPPDPPLSARCTIPSLEQEKSCREEADTLKKHGKGKGTCWVSCSRRSIHWHRGPHLQGWDPASLGRRRQWQGLGEATCARTRAFRQGSHGQGWARLGFQP